MFHHGIGNWCFGKAARQTPPLISLISATRSKTACSHSAGRRVLWLRLGA